MYKHILVATDGSALSKLATTKAIELASELGSQLTIINVIPRIMNSLFDGSFSIPAKQKIELMGKLTDSAQFIVDRVQKDAEKAGVNAKTLVIKSNIVSDAIIHTATKKNVDLIVMASHGRNGINRMLLGSETLQVLTHSDIAVLVLR
jgi:nucleotide-binding universal stress UspA family protein